MENIERLTARGEYEELKEEELGIRVRLRSHIQTLHNLIPVPELRGEIKISAGEAEILIREISELDGQLKTALVRKSQIQKKWNFKETV